MRLNDFRADGDHVRFAIAALGVSGVMGLAFAIRGDPTPPESPAVLDVPGPIAGVPVMPVVVAGPGRVGLDPAAVAPAERLTAPPLPQPLPASPGTPESPLTTRVALAASPRRMPPGAPGGGTLPARRLRPGSSAPLAVSRIVSAGVSGPAAPRGPVSSAIALAGRQVGSSVRTVGRVLQRVF